MGKSGIQLPTTHGDLWFCTKSFQQLEAPLKTGPQVWTQHRPKRGRERRLGGQAIAPWAGQHTLAAVPVSPSQAPAPPRTTHPARPGAHGLRDQAALGQELSVCSFRSHQTNGWGEE